MKKHFNVNDVSSLQISAATLEDIPALCELLNVLFSQELEFTPDDRLQSHGLAAIIANPAIGCILVARRQQHLIGMVNLLYTISTALGARVAILEDMVVAPSERNTGIGTQLIESAIESAKQAGCRRITLLTDHHNQAAQRFYAKHGFTGSSMIPLRLNLA